MRHACFIYSPRFADYDLGPAHPLRPQRVTRTYELVRACHLLEHEGVALLSPEPAREEVLLLVHDRDFVEAVRATDEGRPMPHPSRYGFGTGDNPIVAGMYGAAALVVGASVLAADQVVEGQVSVAFNPAGGWHHAHRARAAGFCIFNDPALAIARVLQRAPGAKVAYVDIDAHHGDGVQEMFYDRANVLTISVHEGGRFLYPGTGEVAEIGAGEGTGYSVNLPLAPFTPDDVYLWAFREGVLPILDAYQPDYVVSQLGADIHYLDPLTHFAVTTHGYLEVVNEIAARAPRWIAIGGGGYEVTVVPRAWTLAWARMLEMDPPQYIPKRLAKHFGGGEARIPLHDATLPTLDRFAARAARAFAEESLRKIKELLFPLHGLSQA